MASIQFDSQTVHDTMCLIDDHREELRDEYQYIKMCNMLKSVHQLTSNGNLQETVQNFVSIRSNTLREKHATLLEEYKRIPKPVVNNLSLIHI